MVDGCRHDACARLIEARRTHRGALRRGVVDGRHVRRPCLAPLVDDGAPWHHDDERPVHQHGRRGLSAGEGYAIEPTRTYAENTVTWLSYYLTWPLLALAAVGLAVLAYRAIAAKAEVVGLPGRRARAQPAVLSRGPQIVPDQLWAIRRFEPATLPGLAIAAGVGAWWVAHLIGQRWPSVSNRAMSIAAIVVVAAPVTTYVSIRPFADEPIRLAAYTYVREQEGARAQIDSLCAVADGRPIILAGTSSHLRFPEGDV